jgi:bacterial/archaeal transporter family protein
MWIILAVVSAVILGFYDLSQKFSVKGNAVIPVLFFSTFTGALLFLPIILISWLNPSFASGHFWFVPAGTLHDHYFYFLKTIIVGASWTFSYFALKHLPITVAGPISASGPAWIIIGAITIFGERLSFVQWIGIAVTLVFYYFFSLTGSKEGINFRKNKWVLFMLLSTIIGSVSALYDKYLIAHFNRLAVQSYSNLYMIIIFLPLLLFYWYPRRKEGTPFQWRATIPMIAVFLAVSDFVYFFAIAKPGSLIAIISSLRRGNVIVSFAIGSLLFKEKNIRQKALILVGILAGIIMIILGS